MHILSVPNTILSKSSWSHCAALTLYLAVLASPSGNTTHYLWSHRATALPTDTADTIHAILYSLVHSYRLASVLNVQLLLLLHVYHTVGSSGPHALCCAPLPTGAPLTVRRFFSAMPCHAMPCRPLCAPSPTLAQLASHQPPLHEAHHLLSLSFHGSCRVNLARSTLWFLPLLVVKRPSSASLQCSLLLPLALPAVQVYSFPPRHLLPSWPALTIHPLPIALSPTRSDWIQLPSQFSLQPPAFPGPPFWIKSWLLWASLWPSIISPCPDRAVLNIWMGLCLYTPSSSGRIPLHSSRASSTLCYSPVRACSLPSHTRGGRVPGFFMSTTVFSFFTITRGSVVPQSSQQPVLP